MELKEFIALFRRWSWLLVLGAILGSTGGFLASRIQTPVYEASAKVLVSKSRQQGGTDILSISDQQLVLTYLQLLKTRPILDEAGAKLGVPITLDNVQVNIVPDTQIIQIKVQEPDPKQAVAIANTLVQVLIEQNETLYAGRYAVYAEGLNSQIAQVQKQITTLQSQITQINQATLDEQLNLVNQQIKDIQDEISNLEADISKFPSLLSTLDRAKLTQKQTEVDQLRSLLSLYQQIQTNLTFIGKPTQGGTARDDPQMTSLQSTLSLYQNLYLNLLNNLAAVQLAQVQSVPTVSQIEAAGLPESPIRPIPLLYTALAGFVGLALTAGAILLMDYFDDTVKSSQKIRELLGVPLLGEIIEADQTRKNRSPNSVSQASSSFLNAFGILRINISRLVTQKQLRTILVTSPILSDGKTTIATNLAKAFVQSGKKVALLDADLSHPSLHSQFGLDNQKGLGNILEENIDWHEAARESNGITVITSGVYSLSSIVLLESDRTTQLLKQLQKEVDVIIIDGPPLLVVDSQILASKAGSILLVVRQGGTSAGVARAMLDQLNLMGANVLGVVVNRVRRSRNHNLKGYYRNALQEKPKEKIEKVAATQS
ncbi:MAG TPA: polysaccharide biosynthesis tyrosine autokinase [Anaerolineales bacterium]|nr:polysaccharide biosynthesis tyrosine autokinase [Anaerolineales bacterium]